MTSAVGNGMGAIRLLWLDHFFLHRTNQPRRFEMTSLRLKAVAAALIGASSIVATRSSAQDVAVLPQTAVAPATAPPMAAQQVDQLVAPVALYSDPLLVDVLTASSYPVEVVEAQHWISN